MLELNEVFTEDVINSIKRQRVNRVSEVVSTNNKAIKVIVKSKYSSRTVKSINQAARIIGASPAQVSNNLYYGAHLILGGIEYTIRKV